MTVDLTVNAADLVRYNLWLVPNPVDRFAWLCLAVFDFVQRTEVN